MTARLLLVEDHPPDVLVMQRALRNFATLHKLYVADHGETAMQYLRGKDRFLDGTLPDLILLDLNLPKMSGYEVLQELKRDPELSVIPVLVLSGSEAENDVLFCYSSGACAYLVKPGTPDVARRLISAIEAVWFTLGRTPRSA